MVDSLKLLHIGEAHLGAAATQPERREDFALALERAVIAAVDAEVDAVLLAGRLFHRPEPDAGDVIDARRRLRRLAEADIPLFAPGASRWVEVAAEACGLRLLGRGANAELRGVPMVGGPTLHYPLSRSVVERAIDAVLATRSVVLAARWVGPVPSAEDGPVAALARRVRYGALDAGPAPWRFPAAAPVLFNAGALEPPRPELHPPGHPGGALLVTLAAGEAPEFRELPTATRPILRLEVDAQGMREKGELLDAIAEALRGARSSLEADTPPVVVVAFCDLAPELAFRLDNARLRHHVEECLGSRIISLRRIRRQRRPGESGEAPGQADLPALSHRVLTQLVAQMLSEVPGVDPARARELTGEVVSRIEDWHRHVDPARRDNPTESQIILRNLEALAEALQCGSAD